MDKKDIIQEGECGLGGEKVDGKEGVRAIKGVCQEGG